MSACYGQRGQDTTGVGASDYYGTSLNAYNNCYSPPLQQFASYTPAAAVAALQNGTDFTGATVTTPVTTAGSVGTTSGSSTPGPTTLQQRLHQPSTSPAATAQASSSSTNNSTSCKFASTPESITNPIGSPQDLSVTAGGNGPGSSGSDQSAGGTAGVGAGVDGDAADGSEGASASSGNGSSNSKSSPHIYPWMKRVHLGQSE